MSTPSSVITFWLGELDERGCADAEHSARWWMKDEDFDRQVESLFAGTYEDIVAGHHDTWLDSARGRLAAILVLDQFARNMFRGTPRMYAADSLAQRLVREGIERGHDRALPLDARLFFYMPLMHAEDEASQDQCVEIFESIQSELEGELASHCDGFVRAARQHRDIVARFGRFPHRNAILGRETDGEEARFLRQPGSSF